MILTTIFNGRHAVSTPHENSMYFIGGNVRYSYMLDTSAFGKRIRLRYKAICLGGIILLP
jgi:hypothetical protein